MVKNFKKVQNMAILWILAVIVGFVFLVKGADLFVDGAAGIAAKLKVSSFIIGLTIVALGTSAPEAAVSIIGGIKALRGNTEAASVIMGNVLGSNMINILLILGISALVARIPVEKSSRHFELPFLIVVSLAFIILGDLGNSFEWYDGLILIVLYVLFMTYTIVMAKRTQPALLEADVTAVQAEERAPRTGFFGWLDRVGAKYEELKDKVWFLIVITVVGLGIVVLGAQLVVDGATYIAQELLRIPTSPRLRSAPRRSPACPMCSAFVLRRRSANSPLWSTCCSSRDSALSALVLSAYPSTCRRSPTAICP